MGALYSAALGLLAVISRAYLQFLSHNITSQCYSVGPAKSYTCVSVYCTISLNWFYLHVVH